MAKRLEDMTLEELWELFPIIISPHNPDWSLWAEEEINGLSAILSDYALNISHIGSTAIPSIMAKPIIDILVEIADGIDMEAVKSLMADHMYICMAESDNRLSFNKGYTTEGYAERVFHVHIHRAGDNDEIRFRDYLISHPDAAKEYENLKVRLLHKYRHDRDGYTAAKTPFIKRILSARKNAR